MKAGIEDFTGHRPTTCPWRAAYDPIVSAAARIVFDAKDGLAPIDEDTPAVWIDAARAFSAARRATEVRDQDAARKKRASERR